MNLDNIEALQSALESVVWQHAQVWYRDGKYWIGSSGATSDISEAFDALAWPDPRELTPEERACRFCDEPGCTSVAGNGWNEIDRDPTSRRRLTCGKHTPR